MGIIEKINFEGLRTDLPDFRTGDTVRIHQLIQEGGKERVQVFEGIVLRRSGGGVNQMVTVRKVSYNVGVERIFPIHSPRIRKIEVKQKGRVRRARLYYLRDLRGKAAKIQQARYTGAGQSSAATENGTPGPEDSTA
jgi:large subunit ribosomal protein L19